MRLVNPALLLGAKAKDRPPAMAEVRVAVLTILRMLAWGSATSKYRRDAGCRVQEWTDMTLPRVDIHVVQRRLDGCITASKSLGCCLLLFSPVDMLGSRVRPNARLLQLQAPTHFARKRMVD